MQYRIVDGTIRYKPRMSSGAIQLPNLTNTSVDICFGWQKDPTNIPGNYNSSVRFGGVVTSAYKPASCKIGKSGWLWTTTATNSPSVIDLRQCTFGAFYVYADQAASSAAASTIADFVFDLTIQFRGSTIDTVIGDAVVERFRESSLRHQQLKQTCSSLVRRTSDEEKSAFVVLDPDLSVETTATRLTITQRDNHMMVKQAPGLRK